MTRQRIDTASTGLSLAWSQTLEGEPMPSQLHEHNGVDMDRVTARARSGGNIYRNAGRTAFLSIRYGSR